MVNAYYCCGFACINKGDKEQALLDYNMAIQYNQNDLIAFNNRDHEYYLKDDFSKAIEDFEAVLHIDLNYIIARNNLEQVLRSAGKVKHWRKI